MRILKKWNKQYQKEKPRWNWKANQFASGASYQWDCWSYGTNVVSSMLHPCILRAELDVDWECGEQWLAVSSRGWLWIQFFISVYLFPCRCLQRYNRSYFIMVFLSHKTTPSVCRDTKRVWNRIFFYFGH